MVSTFFGLEMAKRALNTQQMALDVTGQNVSNASTQGYTRQIANLQATSPLEVNLPGHQVSLGTGVTMSGITRARDAYLDSQYRYQTTKQQYWGERQSALQNIEGFLNEPSNTGLNGDLSNFWNAWSDLSNDPQNMGARSVVKEKALTLTDDFHNLAQQITSLQSSQDNKVQNQIHQINEYATQIQSLNQQIKQAQLAGADPNDLLDQRDNIVDQLAKIVNLTVTEKQDPVNSKVTDFSVAIGGTPTLTGASLVQNVAGASAATTLAGGNLSITVGSASPLNITVTANESLANIASAINAANAGVTASVAAVTGGYQLFLNNAPGNSKTMTFNDTSGLGVSAANIPAQLPPQTLVDDNTVYALKDPVTSPGSAGSPALPVWATGSYASMQVNLGNQMGSLAANIDLRDNYLNNLMTQMNTLAQGVANAVNDLQRSGQGLTAETQTTSGGAPVGIDFFTTSQGSADPYTTPASLPSGITAANITLNQALSDNANRIATGLLTKQAQEVASSVQNVASATASTTVGAGTFTIAVAGGAPKTITVNTGDSLSTIANSINSAGAGVTATVKQASGGYQLVLTDSTAGVDNTASFADTSGTVLQTLGIVNNGWKSNVYNVANAETATNLPGGTLTIGVGSATPVSIAVNQNESLSDITAAINAANAGVTASVAKVSGGYQLSINKQPGSSANLNIGDESGLGTSTANLQSNVQNVTSGSSATNLSGGTLNLKVGTAQYSISVSQNESLNNIASAINTATSSVLASAQLVNGSYQLVINPPSAATPLLINSDNTGLGMAVQTAVAASPVATVIQPAADETVKPGDSSVAKSIAVLAQGWASLQNQIARGDFGSAGTNPVSASSFADYYAANVSQVGMDAQEANQMKSGQDALVNQANNQRQSYSGVSLDEEMTNMIQHQKSYTAAARMVTVMDDMLNTIVTGLGITR